MILESQDVSWHISPTVDTHTNLKYLNLNGCNIYLCEKGPEKAPFVMMG